MSKGAKALLELVKLIYPNQRIELEHNVAIRGGLFIDFIKAKRRDANKDQRCEEEGITLIRVAYNEEMTKDLVLSKLEEATNG